MSFLATLGGITSALGGVFSNHENKAEAQRVRKWEAEMSNTAHQREVADLREAGLNPMLTMGHPGASTPNAPVAKISDPVTPAVNSALVGAQIEKVKAETFATNAMAKKTIAETPDVTPTEGGETPMTYLRDKMHAEMQDAFYKRDISEATRYKLNEEIANIKTEGDILKLEKRLKALGIPEAAAIADFYRTQYGRASKYFPSATSLIHGATSAIGAGAAAKYIFKNMPAYKKGITIRPSKKGRGKFIDRSTGEIFD